MERLMKQLSIIVLFVLSPLLAVGEAPREVVLANMENIGMVIDVPDARFYDGVNLQVWEYYSTGQNQTFYLDFLDNDTVIIEAEFLKEKAFDVTDGVIQNNQPVQLWYVHPQSNIQTWKLDYVDKYFVFRSCLDDNYVLAVESPVQNGSKVVIQRFTGEMNQKWVIMPYKDERYKALFDEYKALHDKAR